jgi:hypothetical protein
MQAAAIKKRLRSERSLLRLPEMWGRAEVVPPWKTFSLRDFLW